MKWCLIALLFAVSGCTRQQPSVLPPITLDEPVSPYAGKFIRCAEAEAEGYLDVFVTVKGEFTRRRHEIPIRRAANKDRPHRGHYFCIAGSEGGFGGTIDVEPAVGDALSLKLSMRYSSPRGDGELNEVIEIYANHDGTQAFNEDWVIEWLWCLSHQPPDWRPDRR